jgi:PEGA domain
MGRMLAADLTQRYASAELLYRDLSALLNKLYPSYTARDFCRRISDLELIPLQKPTTIRTTLSIPTQSHPTQTGSTLPLAESKKPSELKKSNWKMYALVVAIAFAAIYSWINKSQFMRLSQTTDQNVVALSNQQTIVRITSAPSGAAIWIDGQSSGFSTPARVPLSSNREQKISFRLPGHIECNKTFSKNIAKIHCDLKRSVK